MDISVYMPVYNGENFIKRCIDSILSQEFNGTFELIIVDDGSEDNTISLIEEYDDERIKLFKQPHLGIVEASNFGLEQCSGKYIARIDCDDVMMPNRLQLQYDFLESHEEYGICCGDAYFCFGKVKLKKLSRETEITHNMLLSFYPITHSCVMHRSELNLRYDKEYEYGEDVKLFLDCVYNGIRIYSLKDVLCEYHMHDQQISKANKDKNREMTVKAQNYHRKLKGGIHSAIANIIEKSMEQ